MLLTACSSKDATAPAVKPTTTDGANLRVYAVVFTQGAQENNGSIPMVIGQPMVANVLITRSRESVESVPVVLRLFRGGTLLRADTAHTGGILGPTISYASPSAQILVPGSAVRDSLRWQVEIDPLRTAPDSSRTDNLFPSTAPGSVASVTLPPLELHFVPITLSQHEGITGNISASNAEQYASGTRAMLPTGALTTSIGSPVTSRASFGIAPEGAAPTFWRSVLQDLDIARVLSNSRGSVWLGIVPLPAGYTTITNGGFGFVPEDPTDNGAGTRTAVSLEITPSFGAAYSRNLVTHELGHTFGRSHAPGCGALAPVDAQFPGALGSIGIAGHDVFAWASGFTTAAFSVGANTGDVMSYCSPIWTSPYTWNAVLRWREASIGVITRTVRTRATLVAGSITAGGQVSLRPALDADVSVPADAPEGDVLVELRNAGGAVVGHQRVRSTAVDHDAGVRQFLAVVASTGSAAQIIATTRAGASARISSRSSIDAISARMTRTGGSDITSSAGNALLARDAASGEMLGIGWNGHLIIDRSGGYTVTVSDGVRSRQAVVIQR